MQETTMVVMSLYGILSITLFVLWIKHKSVLRQRQKLASKISSMKGNLVQTSEKLDLLSRGVDTILSDAPEVHELLGVHKSLEAAESLLFNQGIPVSNSESCAIASHAAKSLLDHYEGDPEEERIIVQGLQPLSKRLAAILTEAEMKAEDVELSANEHRRLGELFHSIERFDWAADCYHRANDLDPEDEAALRSLSDIQRKSGELDSLDMTLERLLAIAPDDIDLLNEQLVLLDGSEDERYVRNAKRLEGLGAPKSLSAIDGDFSQISQRAKESADLGPYSSDTASALVEKATKQLMLGEFRPALESVESAIQRDQNYGQAWTLKARLVAVEAGSMKDAMKSLRRANALGEYTVILESEILENDGRTDASIEVLEEHLHNSPGDSEARGRLSQLWLSSGSPDSARQILEEAPEEAWNSSTLHIMMGRLSLVDSDHHRDETGKVDQIPVIDALVSFDRAIEIDRESGLAWLGRARALRYQGAFDEAEVALVRARRLIPEHPSISLEEAQLFLEIGDLEQANALTLEATTTLKDNQTVPFIRGIIAAKHGRFREAIKLFSDTLSFDPKHARARLNRSSAALLCDDLAMALDDATQLVEERPNHELGRLRKSEILMNQGDWENAESELRELLKLSHNHSMGLVHLGTCMIAMGKSEQAEKPLNKAIEANPRLSEAWYQRGLLYVDFGRSEKAISDFEAAVRTDPQHLDARLRIAAILHEGRDVEKAATAWRQVLDVDSQNRLARRRLEECREQINTKREALVPKD